MPLPHGTLENLLLTDSIMKQALPCSSGRYIQTPGARILLPGVFGFCRGVTRALSLAMRAIESTSGRVILLGEIIHNPYVNGQLVKAGVVIPAPEQFRNTITGAGAEDCIIIPAFGIEQELESLLQTDCRARILDATCDDVRRIWSFVDQERQQGRTIILFGKPSHSEIKATLSRSLGQNCVIVVPGVKSARTLAERLESGNGTGQALPVELCQGLGIAVYNAEALRADFLSLASQTTMLYSETIEVAEIFGQVAARLGGSLNSCSTICRATQQRQDAAVNLCREHHPDLVLVIGGYDSSNTANLYRIVREYQKTFFIEGAHCITSIGLAHHDPDSHCDLLENSIDWKELGSVALLAGASCPSVVIGDTVRALTGLL